MIQLMSCASFIIALFLSACNAQALLERSIASPALHTDTAPLLPPPSEPIKHPEEESTNLDRVIRNVEQARETVERRTYILDHRAAKDLP